MLGPPLPLQPSLRKKLSQLSGAFGVIEDPEPVLPGIPALGIFLSLLRDKQSFAAVKDQMVSNFSLCATRSAEVLRAPKNKLRNERNGKQLLGLLFSPSCTTLWNWHVHLLCQFRFGVSKNSFAGTGVLSQMLFAWSKSRKLVYLHDAVWKDRSYFQLTAHRLNE